MVTVDRFRAEDRAAVDALFRRQHGEVAAQAYLQRWNWQYARNPNLPEGLPLIWLARLDGEVIGQYPTIPVKVMVNGTEIDAAWGCDVMLNPEHQRHGIGRILFETWDRNVGASIAMGLTDASHGLFKKLRWPDMGRVPRLVKSVSARVQDSPPSRGRLGARLRCGIRNLMTRFRLPGGDTHVVRQFDEGVTRLWERVGQSFAFAVRRDAAYLNWKFVEAPHLDYVMATCVRDNETCGYVAIRHVEQEGWRATIIVDFLSDPGRPDVLQALLRWVDRAAIAARSDVIRVHATNARYIDGLHSAGYADRDPVMRFVAQINAVEVPPHYYDSFADWHVTMGDSDNDR